MLYDSSALIRMKPIRLCADKSEMLLHDLTCYFVIISML